MKPLSIEGYINTLDEECIWILISDYEEWKETGNVDDCFLRQTAIDFCNELKIPKYHYVDYMTRFAIGAYRHFALKYKNITG
jgi:hypothetical protein